VQINEALIGVSSELAELCLALGRAEEKAQLMLSRASAIDALLDNGVLDVSIGIGDIVEAEFRQIEADNAVEKELKALRQSKDSNTVEKALSEVYYMTIYGGVSNVTKRC